jgi:hypothetical protein
VEEELITQAVARFGTGSVRFISDNESRVPFETLNALAISYEELRWPPKSRHLSPFNTIWSFIEKSIRLQRGQPRNALELWDYVSLMWESSQPSRKTTLHRHCRRRGYRSRKIII